MHVPKDSMWWEILKIKQGLRPSPRKNDGRHRFFRAGLDWAIVSPDGRSKWPSYLLPLTSHLSQQTSTPLTSHLSQQTSTVSIEPRLPPNKGTCFWIYIESVRCMSSHREQRLTTVVLHGTYRRHNHLVELLWLFRPPLEHRHVLSLSELSGSRCTTHAFSLKR